ncbi:MAG: hydroxymethylbilane synthase [Rhodospirillaceae bacterium]
MTDRPLFRIGTRGSPLATAQTLEARDRLAAAVPALAGAGAMEVVEIKTSGDAILDRPLAEVGGKGLFTKELDAALLDGRIDIAVHSVKDVETFLPDGVVLAACLEREDPRDAFLSLKAPSLAELLAGSVVGSASLRRQAQILNRRPDLKVTLIRGNVQTRLAKLADGACDATVLAVAGLNRLGMAEKASAVLSPEEMLPAVGQGAIGITCRADDTAALEFLAAVDHAESHIRVRAERALLAALDGSCRTPIGGLAEISGSRLRLRGLVAKADGSAMYETEREGALADAEALGDDAGRELRARAGDDLFA